MGAKSGWGKKTTVGGKGECSLKGISLSHSKAGTLNSKHIETHTVLDDCMACNNCANISFLVMAANSCQKD